MQHQALCIISSPYVNLSWSYGPETAAWGFDLCDLNLWLLTLTFCKNLTLVIRTNPEYFLMIPWLEHSEKGVTGGQGDRRTEPFIEVLGCG